MLNFSDLIKLIKTDEVINWRNLIEHFEQDLKIGDLNFPATDAFKSEEGAKRWSDFKTRIVEHVCTYFINFFKFSLYFFLLLKNMRVMAKYYTRIYTKRMSNLLDLNDEETEEFLSNLVINKTISGKVDRLAGIVTFESQKDPNEMLNDWSNNLTTLMNSINKTTHLINKEEMVHAVKN